MQKILVGTAIWACLSGLAAVQTTEAAGPPPLIPFSGAITAPSGGPHVGLVSAIFALYEASEGGVPLWVDIQVVQTDADGWYLTLLGAYTALPVDLFASSQALWLGVQPEGQPEQPRERFLSVPYALKAADADTIGGQPLSAFVLSSNLDKHLDRMIFDATETNSVSGSLVSSASDTFGTLTVNGESNLLGNVGVGTTSPTALLAVKQTGTASSDGLRIVQAGGGTSDQSLNSHHDGFAWIISPAYSSGGGLSDIQFTSAIGGLNTMRLTKAGNVGIGTASPLSKLHVAGDLRVDGNIAAKYQDVAEWVKAVGALTPGTVVVADSLRRNVVKIAEAPYDTAVLGAVSLQPGLILGEAGPNKVLVAQSGRVKVKVDASYGPMRSATS